MNVMVDVSLSPVSFSAFPSDLVRGEALQDNGADDRHLQTISNQWPNIRIAYFTDQVPPSNLLSHLPAE